MSALNERENNTMVPNESDPESQRRRISEGAADDDDDDNHGSSSTTTSQKDEEPGLEPLTRQHIWNLALCLLAWGFTVANVTLGKNEQDRVVETVSVNVWSICSPCVRCHCVHDSSHFFEPTDAIASMPLGTFFVGSSFVSLTVTPWVFPKWGRKGGFFTGIAFGLLGTALGAISVQLSSPGLYIASTFFFGMAMGIGFALRFAAVEVVPPHWASRAVTLVVSGGVIAAFAGPESAEATRGAWGEENLTYIGVFLSTGVFNICNLICTALVSFPHPKGESNGASSVSAYSKPQELREMISNRQFMVPMMVAVVGWSAMGMPMSLVRVVMKQLGYSTTDSLRVIELHFLGMYFPGFFTGNLIKMFGPKAVCWASVFVFGIAQAILFLPKDESESIWLWCVGLILVGVAWNFAFTASTVWLLQKGRPDRKATLQAANDCLMFLLAGAGLFASSYIFEAGGSGLDGWHSLNWVVVGANACMAALLVLDAFLDRASR
eukprot:scaffold7349_cov173-Amphora_coffeaeformis.AAC.95